MTDVIHRVSNANMKRLTTESHCCNATGFLSENRLLFRDTMTKVLLTASILPPISPSKHGHIAHIRSRSGRHACLNSFLVFYTIQRPPFQTL